MDAQALMQRPDGKVLRTVLEETKGKRDTYVSISRIGTLLELPEADVADYLERLESHGLVRHSQRLSGGWQITATGKEALEAFEVSRSSGAVRQEHVMRAILHELAQASQRVTGDEFLTWKLNENGTPLVARLELETYLDLLEDKGLIKSLHSLQRRHIRTEITSQGRSALARTDLRLAELSARQGVLHNEQGIKIDTGDSHKISVQTKKEDPRTTVRRHRVFASRVAHHPVTKWLGGVLTALFVAFLVYLLGLNG